MGARWLATQWGRKRREALDWVAGIWNSLEPDLTLLCVHLSIQPPVQTFIVIQQIFIL